MRERKVLEKAEAAIVEVKGLTEVGAVKGVVSVVRYECIYYCVCDAKIGESNKAANAATLSSFAVCVGRTEPPTLFVQLSNK